MVSLIAGFLSYHSHLNKAKTVGTPFLLLLLKKQYIDIFPKIINRWLFWVFFFISEKKYLDLVPCLNEIKLLINNMLKLINWYMSDIFWLTLKKRRLYISNYLLFACEPEMNPFQFFSFMIYRDSCCFFNLQNICILF